MFDLQPACRNGAAAPPPWERGEFRVAAGHQRRARQLAQELADSIERADMRAAGLEPPVQTLAPRAAPGTPARDWAHGRKPA